MDVRSRCQSRGYVLLHGPPSTMLSPRAFVVIYKILGTTTVKELPTSRPSALSSNVGNPVSSALTKHGKKRTRSVKTTSKKLGVHAKKREPNVKIFALSGLTLTHDDT